jgi:hypothetical protein
MAEGGRVNVKAELAAYWARVHCQPGDSGALSGSTLQTHIEFLGVGPLVQPGARILCIGVGTGEWIRELTRGGWLCSALDICPEALRRVPVPGYLDPRHLPGNAFDLALSYWVSPHMPAEALQAQLCGVIPALLPGGIFALHFNEPTGPDPRMSIPEVHAMIDARSTFAREQIAAMARAAGGQVLRYVSETPDPARARNYLAVHLGRI